MECVQLEDAELNKTVFVIGTVEKRSKRRPSVLRELAAEEVIVETVEEPGASLEDEDFIEFEDEKQIVKIEVTKSPLKASHIRVNFQVTM